MYPLTQYILLFFNLLPSTENNKKKKKINRKKCTVRLTLKLQEFCISKIFLKIRTSLFVEGKVKVEIS